MSRFGLLVVVALVLVVGVSAQTTNNINVNFAGMLAGINLGGSSSSGSGSGSSGSGSGSSGSGSGSGSSGSGSGSMPAPILSGTFNSANPNITVFNIIQVNDVYEISPIAQGTLGGLAEFSTFKKWVISQNPHHADGVITALAGDFISPSAMDNAPWDNDNNPATPMVPLQGVQMVDILNAVGLDVVTIGNHEFDYSGALLQARIAQSNFPWINCNAWFANGTALDPQILPYLIIVKQEVRFLWVGTVINEGAPSWVEIIDGAAGEQLLANMFTTLQPQYDIGVAMPHWYANPTDWNLATLVGGNPKTADPLVHVIVAGHDHVNQYYNRNYLPIAVADANAKSAWLHSIHWDGQKMLVDHVDSKLYWITSDYTPDPAIQPLVDYWTQIAFAGFLTIGFNATKQIATLTHNIDCVNLDIQTLQNSEIGLLACNAMLRGSGANIAWMWVMQFRLDDYLYAGPIYEYDILRLLPLFSNYSMATVTAANGAALNSYLTTASTSTNRGLFVVPCGATMNSQGQWIVTATNTSLTALTSPVTIAYVNGNQNTGFSTLISNVQNEGSLDMAVMNQFAYLYPITH